MHGEQSNESGASLTCPSCGGALPAEAVLCVVCGFHLKLGHHLATTEDAPPLENALPAVNDNPYASPTAPTSLESDDCGKPLAFDLTEEGARRAESVAVAAESLTLGGITALCCCSPLWLIALPWCAYQYLQWRSLHAQFEELRRPNSFSPHGAVAVRFQAARMQLLAGIIIGLIAWGVLGLIVLLRLLRVAPPR
ncbi:MAG: hypothetical protein RIC55_15105 [Pirellulaceae bacterium]